VVNIIDIVMAFNSSRLLSEPITYLLSVFIDLLGTGFYLIPVSVIAGALFLQKNMDPVVPSMFMITTGALLGGGSIYAGMGDAAVMYIIFCGIGIATLPVSIYFGKR
jgi:hypothetical protein